MSIVYKYEYAFIILDLHFRDLKANYSAGVWSFPSVNNYLLTIYFAKANTRVSHMSQILCISPVINPTQDIYTGYVNGVGENTPNREYPKKLP